MSKAGKARMIDPVAATKQFNEDLAKMRVGPSDGAPRRTRLQSFGLEEQRYRTWSADLTPDQTLDDVFNPLFWATHAEKIMGHDLKKGIGDLINIRQRSSGLLAQVIVLEVGKGFLKCGLVENGRYQPPEITIPEDSPLTLRWNDTERAWHVVNKRDMSVMRGPFQSKGSAADWLVKHLASMQHPAETAA